MGNSLGNTNDSLEMVIASDHESSVCSEDLEERDDVPPPCEVCEKYDDKIDVTFEYRAELRYTTQCTERCSLLEYLCGEGRSMRLIEQIDIASKIAELMIKLKDSGYCYHKLAAANITVTENEISLTKCVVHEHALELSPGERRELVFSQQVSRWFAPEALLYHRHTRASDVWSFGMVFYEIITFGQEPYLGMTIQDICQRFSDTDGNYRMGKPPNCPDMLYEIMLDCWQVEPQERPTFETLHKQLEDYFETNNHKTCLLQ